MTKTIVRKTVLASFALVIIASGVIAGQNLLTTPNTAQAITPPDSCFAFNSGTGTITDYYNNEGNNVANPACPRNVDIPATIGGVVVKVIGNYAFSYNQLTSLTIPNSVTSIGSGAFVGNQLNSVTIPSSITNIRDHAFGNNQLTSVTIPDSVTSIGSSAFATNQLTSVDIPNTVITFGDDIFSGGNLLASIVYAGTTYSLLPSIPEQCFSFSNGTITDYRYADMNLIKNNGIACLSREVDIPNAIGGVAVNSIGDGSWPGAFMNNGITSVSIPNGVTSIGSYAFEANQLTSVIIPNGVTTVGIRAFQNNRLTSVSIPGSVTSIGRAAFAYNQLVSVNISPGLTSINDSTFYANKITSVVIPSTVTLIQPSAFAVQNTWGRDLEYGINDAPYLWSNNPSEVQQAYENIWYVRLYTADPSNSNNLTGQSLSEESWWGEDANENGTINDSLGGHLINPASVETRYISSTGSQLSEPVATTGLKTDGTLLRSYRVTESSVPAPLDPWSITPEEQIAMDAGFAQYYRLGDEVTLEAPTSLSGLSLLTPDSPHTLTLSQATNTVNFVYGTPLRTIDFATPVGSATNPTANSVPSSVTPLLAKSVFSVSDAKACSQIQSASLIDGSDFTAPQTGQDVLGGLSFTIDCTASGGQADVSFALGGTITDLTGVKVYKQDSTNTVTDITDLVQLTNNQTPDGTRTTISYSVTDGASLDDDGTVNGTIVDPIYLTAPTGTSFSLLGASSSSSEALAATGVNIWLTTATALLMLTTGTVIAIQTAQRKQTQ